MGFLGLSKHQLWSILIAVLMVGSILGILASGGSDNSGSSGAPPAQNETPTAIAYSASGVEAKVIQVFPRAIIVAQSDDFETTVVDSKLKAIDGIAAVAGSQFLYEGEISSGNFRTEVRLSSAEKIPEVLEALGSVDSFTPLGFFPYALVSIPREVTFTNEDLGLEMDYNFSSAQIESVIGPYTTSGDELTIAVSAYFQSNQLLQINAFEETNLTSSPVLYSQESEMEISRLESNFFVSGSAPLSDFASIESAIAVLSQIPDANSEISVPEKPSQTSIYFSSSFSEPDLNALLNQNPSIVSAEFFADSNYASIEFSSDSFGEFRDSLAQSISSSGFSLDYIEDPSVSFSGSIVGGERTDVVSAVSGILGSTGIDVSLSQEAVFDANAIYIDDAQKEFPLVEGSFSAEINPVHSEGDSVVLSLQVYASEKNGVEGLYAIEKQD